MNVLVLARSDLTLPRLHHRKWKIEQGPGECSRCAELGLYHAWVSRPVHGERGNGVEAREIRERVQQDDPERIARLCGTASTFICDTFHTTHSRQPAGHRSLRNRRHPVPSKRVNCVLRHLSEIPLRCALRACHDCVPARQPAMIYLPCRWVPQCINKTPRRVQRMSLCHACNHTSLCRRHEVRHASTGFASFVPLVARRRLIAWSGGSGDVMRLTPNYR